MPSISGLRAGEFSISGLRAGKFSLSTIARSRQGRRLYSFQAKSSIDSELSLKLSYAPEASLGGGGSAMRSFGSLACAKA